MKLYTRFDINSFDAALKSAQLTNVVRATKDIIYIAEALRRQGHSVALHNPSDADVVFGNYDVGEYWKTGTGNDFVGEEFLGVMSTAPLNSRGLNPAVYANPIALDYKAVTRQATAATMSMQPQVAIESINLAMFSWHMEMDFAEAMPPAFAEWALQNGMVFIVAGGKIKAYCNVGTAHDFFIKNLSSMSFMGSWTPILDKSNAQLPIKIRDWLRSVPVSAPVLISKPISQQASRLTPAVPEKIECDRDEADCIFLRIQPFNTAADIRDRFIAWCKQTFNMMLTNTVFQLKTPGKTSTGAIIPQDQRVASLSIQISNPDAGMSKEEATLNGALARFASEELQIAVPNKRVPTPSLDKEATQQSEYVALIHRIIERAKILRTESETEWFSIKKEYKSKEIIAALSRADAHFAATKQVPGEAEFLDYRENDALSIRQAININRLCVKRDVTRSLRLFNESVADIAVEPQAGASVGMRF